MAIVPDFVLQRVRAVRAAHAGVAVKILRWSGVPRRSRHGGDRAQARLFALRCIVFASGGRLAGCRPLTKTVGGSLQVNA